MKKNSLYHVLFLILFLPFLLMAGTTGKISGIIQDAETGEPLPGCNIILDGTTMGAATDLEGRYIIINVPPGSYNIRMQMMGYKTQITQNVRILIDLTTKINAKLEPSVLQTEEVTVVAERPLVRVDMTSSLSSVGSSEIASLPVQEVGDVLELQAGIVKSGNNLHIRGGRSGEVGYWVDGVSTTDVFSGGMGVTVENSAIEELQVISGTFNAEYGQAMSGIINIITKEGGPRYTGQFRAYLGDYISNGEEFSVLKNVTTANDPETGMLRAVGDKEFPLKKFNPNYDADFSLSGPVPFSGNKLTFFTNARYFYNEGHLYGREWFRPTGQPGDSSLVPMNPYERTTAQAKLTYKVTSNMKMSYNVFWNSWLAERNYSQNYKYNPYGVPQNKGTGLTQIFSLNHVISPKTFYELRINRFYTESESYVYENPLASPNYLVRVDSDSAANVVGRVIDLSNPDDAEFFEYVKNQRVSYTWIINPDGPEGYVHPDSISTPTTYSFAKVGMDMGHSKRSTAYWVGKLDLSSQVSNTHQLKTGFEFRAHELELHSYTIRPATSADLGEQIVPFQPMVPDVSSIYRSDYIRKPRELSAYVQDKIEFKDLIMNLGLRFDYFDANHVVPVDPSDPNIYAPFKNEHKYKNWQDPPKDLSREELDAYMASMVEYTPDERRAFMHKNVDPKMQISPRVGMAYPITDKGVIHFSYGHFFQIPEFRFLYDNPDFKLGQGGGYYIFGNADLIPQKTVQYEIGLQQQITGDIAIDATLFYRDVRDWVGTSPLITTTIPSIKYSQYENKDYENVRGITIKLEKRHSNNFSARLDYSYQIVEGTYSNPTDAFNAYQNQQEPRLALIPLNWDQNHTLNASVIFQRKQWTVSMIGRYWSGRPYTPSFPRGEFVGGAAVIGLRENSSRLPSQKSIDLYINRQFKLAGVRLNVFMNIYNLTDQRDEVAVYSDTGTAEYTTNIKESQITYHPSRIGTIPDFVNQPGWYSTPRQIQVGLALDF
ncbi:TonB-dependent receptor [candidate division KSB1 bacterium]|nr:TonB-dependent receptor [candidate division KSB1 bacterium]